MNRSLFFFAFSREFCCPSDVNGLEPPSLVPIISSEMLEGRAGRTGCGEKPLRLPNWGSAQPAFEVVVQSQLLPPGVQEVFFSLTLCGFGRHRGAL